MKWKKLGKIFDPTKHHLSNGCTEFAQSPQSLVFRDFIRIYFSTRKKDNNGKYLSYISYIDIDKKFKHILAISTHTVIELGGLGCFDEHGIFPLNIVRDKKKIFGYIGGWNRKISVSVDTSIGLSRSSNNGQTFQRIGSGPVLTSSLHEPFLIGDPFVTLYESLYHMWYIYGTKWIHSLHETEPQRVYKIGHGTSKDGIVWHKEGKQLIRDTLGFNECQAHPTVIFSNKMYHMMFCFRQPTDFRANKQRGYRLGYAYSRNLRDWTRKDAMVEIDLSKNDWDSDMMCYPHLFHCDGNIFLLYNGNEFGRFGFGAAVLEKI